MAKKNIILSIKNLKKYYQDVKAVNGVSFEIEKGVCFGLLGPNGAGKTTTIEVIEGILNPTSGKITYKGFDRDYRYKEQIGIQFQNTELPQFLTVEETLRTFKALYNNKMDLDFIIEICNLKDIWKRDNRKISGGQKQRLLLAMALVNDPELLFLDEPTTGLDPQARRHLWEIVENIKKNNKTIILTTHYMEEAEILCDYLAIIDHGKIVEKGATRDLMEKYCSGASIFIDLEKNIHLFDKLPCKGYKVQNQIEIQTDNVNMCIERLTNIGADFSGMNIRSQNLDDLFLKLTGNQLRA
jgi:ABC-2 type transport system ATP-binding protein